MKRKSKKTFRGTPEEHLSSAAKRTKNVGKLADQVVEAVRKAKCERAFWELVSMSEEVGAVGADLGWSKRAKKTSASERKVNKALDVFNRVCVPAKTVRR